MDIPASLAKLSNKIPSDYHHLLDELRLKELLNKRNIDCDTRLEILRIMNWIRDPQGAEYREQLQKMFRDANQSKYSWEMLSYAGLTLSLVFMTAYCFL